MKFSVKGAVKTVGNKVKEVLQTKSADSFASPINEFRFNAGGVKFESDDERKAKGVKNGGSLGEVVVTAATMQKYIAPFLKHNFVVEFSMGTLSFEGYLKSFSIPKAGIRWSMNEETLWEPMPEIDVASMDIEAYFWKTYSKSIWKLYNNQFSNGLLNLNNKRFTVSIKQRGYKDGARIHTSLTDTLAGYASFAEGFIGAAETLKGNLAGILGTAAGGLAAFTDESQAKYTEGILNKQSPERYNNIMMSFTGCVLDNPTFEADPSSSDIAVLKTRISFIKAFNNKDWNEA